MFELTQHAEKEIVDATLLCDQKGNLNPAAIGYAKKPIILGNLKGHFMRKKKWNNWYIFGDDILFATSIIHLDYAVICSVRFLEYETQRFCEKIVTIPLGKKLKMPERVLETVHLNNEELKLQLLFSNGETHMTVTIPNFEGDLLHADLVIKHQVEDESLNVVVPWNRQTFHLTAKHLSLPVNGYVKLDSKSYTFNEEDCFAVLDFGRGVWPRNTAWNRAMASQKCRGHRIGLNLGGLWTDGTGMTENAFFLDGKLHKIHEDVIFHYNKSDYMKPWQIHTRFTDDVQLSFTPFFEREDSKDLKLVTSSLHHMVGYYNGQIRLENGRFMKIQQMLGTVEEHIAKW